MRESDGAFEEILIFTLALGRLPGIGSKTAQRILREDRALIEAASGLEGREGLERLEELKLGEPEGLDAKFVANLGDGKVGKALEKSEDSWEKLASEARTTLDLARDEGILPLHPYMPQYPLRLLKGDSFPPVLFCKGDPAALNAEKSVAMAGTRHPTDFGTRMGRRLAELFARDGYAIVSGLALGCDTAAHVGALSAGGATVAVLPVPLDTPVYPKENADLARRILEGGGALVSECLPGTRPDGRRLIANLVARDEWQPALADGLIVFETSSQGGSRHALGHAHKAGKPIAVFDYREKGGEEFLEDPRFSGNVEWLLSKGASPIFSRESVRAFERRMDALRSSGGPEGEGGGWVGRGQAGQLVIPMD